MSISIDEYVDVAERATALGCLLPATIAIMPENFDTATTRDEFVVRAEGATLQTLFRNFDYPITSFRPAGERSVAIHNKSADWEATLFVAASLISNNPDLPSMMLELIKRYLQEFFKSEPTKRVKISVVSEKTSKSATKKTYKKLTYEGDIEGLTTLKDAINDVVND